MKISCFKVGAHLFAIDILLVKEISPITEVIKIPGAQHDHYGLMNLRGNIISIIHPSLFAEGCKKGHEERDKIIIFKNNEGLRPLIERELSPERELGNDFIGLLIDKVVDVFEIEKSEIKELSKNISEKLMRVLEGVVVQDNQIISLISIEKFLKEMYLGGKIGYS